MQITDDGRTTRDDAIRLLDAAYDGNDVFGLGRVEIKCFADKPEYTENQGEQKIVNPAGTDASSCRSLL